jgi:hypothetical protein
MAGVDALRQQTVAVFAGCALRTAPGARGWCVNAAARTKRSSAAHWFARRPLRDNTGDVPIYVMNPDGLRREPSWSPDGSKIAFTVYLSRNGEIYAMNAEGTAPTNLTQLVHQDFGPDWQTVCRPPISTSAWWRAPK